MKKSAIYSIILGTFALAGCDKYDIKIPSTLETREFYLKNEEKAQKAVDECKKIKKQNQEILRSLATSAEREEYNQYLYKSNIENFEENCKIAERAIDEIKWNKHEAKEKAEKEARIKKQKEEISAFVQKLKEQYGKTWQEGITNILNTEKEIWSLNLSEVTADDYFNIFRYELGNKDEYLAEGFKRDSRVNGVKALIYTEYKIAGINELMQKEYKDLIADSSYCKTDRRPYSVCNIWEIAVERKRNEVVKTYLGNYEKLKTDYNQCVVEFENYLTSINVGKNDNVDYNVMQEIQKKENEIYSKYPCSETEEALKQLNLSFSHSEKLD